MFVGPVELFGRVGSSQPVKDVPGTDLGQTCQIEMAACILEKMTNPGGKMADRNRLFGLFIFVLLVFFTFNYLIPGYRPTPTKNTVVFHSQKSLWPGQPLYDGGDSWRPMIAAYDYSLLGEETSIYQKIFFEQKIKFQYPPPALFIMAGLDRAGCPPADRASILNLISWVLLAGSVGLTALIFLVGLERDGKGQKRALAPAQRWLGLLAAVFISLTFYPLVRAYTLGQIQVWLNFLLALGVWFWLGQRKGWSGACFGLTGLIKPQYVLLPLWGLVRRQRRFALTALAVVLAGAVASLAFYGWDNCWDYLRSLAYMGRHGEFFYGNQSFNGLLNRLLGTGHSLKWQADAFAPFNPWVYGGTIISSLALLAAALAWPWWRSRRSAWPAAAGAEADLAIMILTATIASPIAWDNHYGVLLTIYALILPLVWRSRQRGRSAALILLGLSYLFVSQKWYFLNQFHRSPWNLVQSYNLAGALLCLAVLYWLAADPGAGTERNS